MKKLFFKRCISLLLSILIVSASLVATVATQAVAETSGIELIDIKENPRVSIGENLYTHEVADGVFPSDWTRYEAPWIWNVKSQAANITASSGKNPAYVTLNNTDGSHTSTSGAVVFPSVGTADYVLTVKMRIGNEYGHFGLITNLTGTDGGTLSYVTMNKSGTSFAGNGSVTLANRWGNGSQTTQMNYESSNIATSANGGMVYPGATLTMKAYSCEGYTYFYINDVLMASGAQRNPEEVNSLCGVYCYNGKFQIYSVSIDALDVKKDIKKDVKITTGENLYTHEVADGVFPSDWTRYEAPWIWNVKSQDSNITASSGRNPAYVTLNNTDGSHTNTSGAVVFPSVGTADYVLTVKMRIGNEYGHFGLITNLTGTEGGTLSYVTLNKSGSSFAGNGSVTLANRWGTGSQTTKTNYQSSNIATSANGGMVYPGATLTLQAYSYDGFTYFYINDVLVASGAQRNPEDVNSLCGVYCCNGKFQIYSVSIDALDVKKDIREDERVSVGGNLYTHEVADGVFPSDWTRYEAPWIWSVKSQAANITVSSNKTPAYVTLNNCDGAHTNTSGAVVFPSVDTADYVLTVKMRIGNEYGHFGLITNLTDPLTEADGGTLSYVTLNKSGTSFAGNGSVTLANRWGSGSQTTQMNYESSQIATSANGGMIYPGATLTMKAYSCEGYTYFYINDEFIACGAQRNPEVSDSLCGVYCYNGKFQIYSVSIDALDVEGKVIPVQTVVDCDFEDNNNLPQYNTDQWSVVYDEATGNNYLQRAEGNSEFNSWGFVFQNTEIIPGRTYKISFKVKSNRSAILEYAVSTAKGYNSSIAELYPSDHNEVKLNTEEWKNVECYFTGKYYSGGTNASFRITTPLWNGTVLSFDDIVIKEVSGMSFCEYDNKYSTPYIVEVDGETLVVPYAPERENYIFEGWYVDGEALDEGYKVVGYKTAIAKWSEAVISKDDIADITKAGNHNLGIKVTNANNYPVKFSLETTGKVTVSIYTDTDKSNFFFNAKSVVWTRTFERGGEIGALITPATIKNYFGNAGDTLYVSLECANGVTASITNFVIGGEGVPTSRKVEGDVNGDEKFNVIDLVRLKKMSVGVSTNSWIGDINGDGFVAEASDIVLTRKGLLGISTVVTEIGDRTLVWNDEFDGNKLNSDNFAFPYDKNFEYSTFPENVNVSDGKLNLNITKSNGRDFAIPSSVVTHKKMSYKYGYLEMRAKIACSPDQWFALWLYSGNSGDHEGYYGEIDIVETNKEGNGYRPNVHVWDWEDGRLAQYAENIPLYSYSKNNFNKTEYHTFGFEWDATSFKFYVDGNMYQEIKFTDLAKSNAKYADIVDDFYSIIIGNGYYSTLSNDDIMPKSSIDYIRLYQKAGEEIKINGVLQ